MFAHDNKQRTAEKKIKTAQQFKLKCEYIDLKSTILHVSETAMNYYRLYQVERRRELISLPTINQ